MCQKRAGCLFINRNKFVSGRGGVEWACLAFKKKAVKQYQFLNEEGIIQYVKKHGFFREDENVSVTEISDGKINHVYRVTGEKQTLIYKQAVPYARTVGETMPLPLDRVRVEARVLQEYDRILPGSDSTGASFG